MARRIMAAVLLFSMAEACGGDVERIRGEISWTTNGAAKIADCQTGRVLEFGTMASSPYFRLMRRYEELSPPTQRRSGRRPARYSAGCSIMAWPRRVRSSAVA